MSTNRPFFSNFLWAFRARSGIQSAPTSSSGAVSGASLSSAYAQAQAQAQAQAHQASSSTTSTSQANFSTASRTTSSAIKPNQQAASSQATAANAVQHANQFQSTTGWQHHSTTSPLSRSPGSPGPPGLRALGARSPPSKQRRGSDSSSDGFREVLGAEKWYIGGRTAAGEEKFYKLSMVKKPRSTDRLSIDRLSL